MLVFFPNRKIHLEKSVVLTKWNNTAPVINLLLKSKAHFQLVPTQESPPLALNFERESSDFSFSCLSFSKILPGKAFD